MASYQFSTMQVKIFSMSSANNRAKSRLFCPTKWHIRARPTQISFQPADICQKQPLKTSSVAYRLRKLSHLVDKAIGPRDQPQSHVKKLFINYTWLLFLQRHFYDLFSFTNSYLCKWEIFSRIRFSPPFRADLLKHIKTFIYSFKWQVFFTVWRQLHGSFSSCFVSGIDSRACGSSSS